MAAQVLDLPLQGSPETTTRAIWFAKFADRPRVEVALLDCQDHSMPRLKVETRIDGQVHSSVALQDDLTSGFVFQLLPRYPDGTLQESVSFQPTVMVSCEHCVGPLLPHLLEATTKLAADTFNRRKTLARVFKIVAVQNLHRTGCFVRHVAVTRGSRA